MHVFQSIQYNKNITFTYTTPLHGMCTHTHLQVLFISLHNEKFLQVVFHTYFFIEGEIPPLIPPTPSETPHMINRQHY